MNKFFVICSGLLCGIVLSVCALVVIPADSWFHWRHKLSNYITGEPVLFLKKQKLSSDYLVPYVRLKEPGYIAFVYADALDTPGVEGDEVGRSTLLPAGTYKNEHLFLSTIRPEANFFVCLLIPIENGGYTGALDSTHTVVCERGITSK